MRKKDRKRKTEVNAEGQHNREHIDKVKDIENEDKDKENEDEDKE